MSEAPKQVVIVDEKLMRGLVKRDIRPLLSHPRTTPLSFSDPKHPIHKTLKPILGRAKTGRLPDVKYLEQFVRDFDTHVLGEALHVQTLGTADLTRFPDHVFKASFYFTLKPGLARTLVLRSSSFWIHNRLIGVQDTDIFEITVHVLERFYERTKMSVLENNANSLGRELIQRLGIFMMLKMPELLAIKSFGVPFADGLLIGTHTGEPPSEFTRSYLDGESLSGLLASATQMSLPRFTTFIGQAELSDRQREFIEKVRLYEKRHHRTLHAFSLIHHAQSEFHRLKEVEGTIRREDASERDMPDAIMDFLRLCLEDSSLKAVGSWALAQLLNEPVKKGSSRRQS